MDEATLRTILAAAQSGSTSPDQQIVSVVVASSAGSKAQNAVNDAE